MTLADLSTGQSAVVVRIHSEGAFRKRITEMGFVKGKVVTVVKKAPLQDPIEYRVMDYNVSLRESEARQIEVVTPEEWHNALHPEAFKGIQNYKKFDQQSRNKNKEIRIALVGNPNAGKTTIFNVASGAHEHVGNYAGVTVEKKEAFFEQDGYTFIITDLPGTYSITSYSPEEVLVRDHLLHERPDVVINILDSSNLERNLYLTTQLIDMGCKVVIALNMFDELERRGDKFLHKKLAQLIGIPIIPTIAKKNIGINELFSKVIDVYLNREPISRKVNISYGEDIETSVKTLADKLDDIPAISSVFPPRFCALKLLENDKGMRLFICDMPEYPMIRDMAQTEISRLETLGGEDTETLLTNAKYGFITGALQETYRPAQRNYNTLTQKIDKWITHKYIGFPIFIFFIWLMFQCTFWLGSYPMQWIEQLVSFAGATLTQVMPDGILKDLLVDGIISGIGGVIVFLPNILILYSFISFMEDTGYMARAAFITDKVMHLIGLHGKSFIPLVMGFGCNVPAIMATRTLENRNDRLLTMLIVPFMSCSARLPVYLVIAGAIFPHSSANVIFSIYLIGIMLSIIVALLLKHTVFSKSELPFVMELPPYRIPTARATSKHIWAKAKEYLSKMGGLILIASIIIWALGYFPVSQERKNRYAQQKVQAEQHYAPLLGTTKNNQALQDSLNTALNNDLAKIDLAYEHEHQENSLLGQLGKFIEPVLRPLGFDWKMGVSLLSGIAAKEVVVSTMSILYQADPSEGSSSQSLIKKLQEQTRDDGSLLFTPIVAYGFMLFVLIYIPCIAVIAAIRKESAVLKWTVFSVVFTSLLAWLVAFLVVHIGALFL